MKINLFWQRWLFVCTLLVILFGVFLMIPGELELFEQLFNSHIKRIFWNDVPITPGIINFQRWMNGVLGATMIGWGIMMAFVVRFPFRNGEKWAWNCIFWGIGSWYILDTLLSIMYLALFNAVFNTLILLLFGLPLAFTYKSFRVRKVSQMRT